jgi:hypothetical protein
MKSIPFFELPVFGHCAILKLPRIYWQGDPKGVGRSVMFETGFGILFTLVAFFVVLWIFILLPAGMASKRGRTAFGWVLLSLLFSPILACLLLLLLGNNPNGRHDT